MEEWTVQINQMNMVAISAHITGLNVKATILNVLTVKRYVAGGSQGEDQQGCDMVCREHQVWIKRLSVISL